MNWNAFNVALFIVSCIIMTIFKITGITDISWLYIIISNLIIVLFLMFIVLMFIWD